MLSRAKRLLFMPQPPQAESDIIVFDDFNRPDGPIGNAVTGQKWVGSGGIWNVYDGIAGVAGASGIHSRCLIDSGVFNCTIECRLIGGNARLIFRHESEGNELGILNGSFYRRLGGNYAVIQGFPTYSADGANIKVALEGSYIQISVNEELLVDRDDIYVGINATKHGISIWSQDNGNFDNFRVSSKETPVFTEEQGGSGDIEGHTEIEYIESVGAQFIRTDVIGRNGLKAELDIMLTVANRAEFLFGSRAAVGQAAFSIYRPGTRFRWDYGNSVTTLGGNQFADHNTRYKLYMDDNKFYVDGVLASEGSPSVFSSGRELTICCVAGGSSSWAHMRVYGCKIWDENNVLLCDLIPVLLSNGVPCMYDKVAEEYFLNQGSGVFLHG